MLPDEIEMIAVKCRLELEAMGVALSVSQDFETVKEKFQMLGKSLGPASSPDTVLLTETNAFYVFATKQGVPVAGFAVRIDDLGEGDVNEFLKRSIHVIFGKKVAHTKYNVFANRRWGKAAFFGDLKAETARALSGEGGKILRLAFMYAHYWAFKNFGVDTSYCFLREADFRRGAHYGFTTWDPFVWETEETIYPDGNPAWVMQTTKERLPSMLASVVDSLTHFHRKAENEQTRRGVMNNTAGGSE